MTVQTLLDKTGGGDYLVATLQRSEQIGGTRWTDGGQTCQVRLDISGPRARQALLSIATNKKSPIDPQLLAVRLQNWDNKTFSAIGTSTGSGALAQLQPDAQQGEAWSRISDQARQQAATAAKQSAAADVETLIKPIPLGIGTTVADALAHPEVKSAVDSWLASRPVTQVEFRDDLQVRVTLATPPGELFDVVRASAEKQKDLAAAVPPAGWDKARDEFLARIPATAHGSARAGVGAVPRAAIHPSGAIPDWADDQVDAEGAGTPCGAPLKAARAAERDAQAQLRTKVESLPLAGPPPTTLGALAKQDPRVADAINRSLDKARLSKVRYLPDGGAKVRLTLDLRGVWDEIAP
jgi:hypothetical protein